MWEVVAALAAVAGIGVGAWAIIADGVRTRRVLKVDLLARLVDRFESPAFEEHRIKAARYLLGEPGDSDYGIRSLDIVLNFFETLALYRRYGALDDHAIWHTFSAWLLPYCIVGEGYIDVQRNRDQTSYEDLRGLQGELEQMEQRRGGLFAVTAPRRVEEAGSHLRYEAKLPRAGNPALAPDLMHSSNRRAEFHGE